MSTAASSKLSRTTAKALGHQTIRYHSEVILALPWTDAVQANQAAEILLARSGHPAELVLIHDDLNAGPATLINQTFALSDSKYFVYLAQDVFPSRQWLHQSVGALQKTRAGLLGLNDGKWMGRLASFGVVDREWAQSVYGGESLFYSGYRQHFGDVELTLIAMQQKRFAYDPNAVMLEIDFQKEAKAVLREDRELFAARKLGGFEGRVRSTELLGMFG